MPPSLYCVINLSAANRSANSAGTAMFASELRSLATSESTSMGGNASRELANPLILGEDWVVRGKNVPNQDLRHYQR